MTAGNEFKVVIDNGWYTFNSGNNPTVAWTSIGDNNWHHVCATGTLKCADIGA